MNATISIHKIDGLFIPCEEIQAPVGPRGGMHPVSNYWGYGYATFEAAEIAVCLTEAGEITPPGIPVSTTNGKRRS